MVPLLTPLSGTGSVPSVTTGGPTTPNHGSSFAGTLQNALAEISQSQHAAAAAENAVATGAPGASTATALVLSDKAEVNWTALVAVRNEVVSAYQTIMNMQI